MYLSYPNTTSTLVNIVRGGKQCKVGDCWDWAKYGVALYYRATMVTLKAILGHHEMFWLMPNEAMVKLIQAQQAGNG